MRLENKIIEPPSIKNFKNFLCSESSNLHLEKKNQKLKKIKEKSNDIIHFSTIKELTSKFFKKFNSMESV